jgi:hypothetical protein
VKSTIVCEERWLELLREFGCEDVLVLPNGSLWHGTVVARNQLWQVSEKHYDMLVDFIRNQASIFDRSRVNAIIKRVICPSMSSDGFEDSFQIEQWNRISAQFTAERIRDAMVISRMTGWGNLNVLMNDTQHALENHTSAACSSTTPPLTPKNACPTPGDMRWHRH